VPQAIDAGLKVLGRAGRFAIAALDVETGDSGESRGANLFASRVTYDAGSHLRLGAVAPAGRPRTGATTHSPARPAVADQHLPRRQEPRLRRLDGALERRPAVRSPRRLGVQARLPNDLWDLSLAFNSYGEALDPALGFLPRPGTRKLSAGGAYQPRPARDGRLSWARQFFFDAFVTRVERLDGTVESWRSSSRRGA